MSNPASYGNRGMSSLPALEARLVADTRHHLSKAADCLLYCVVTTQASPSPAASSPAPVTLSPPPVALSPPPATEPGAGGGVLNPSTFPPPPIVPSPPLVLSPPPVPVSPPPSSPPPVINPPPVVLLPPNSPPPNPPVVLPPPGSPPPAGRLRRAVAGWQRGGRSQGASEIVCRRAAGWAGCVCVCVAGTQAGAEGSRKLLIRLATCFM